MIGRRGERGSGISVLAARHDDDAIIYTYICVYACFCIYIYIYFLCLCMCGERESERERERERFEASSQRCLLIVALFLIIK